MKRPHLLYVIRHGQTDWNAAGRYQGQKDIPLNNHGRAQAARNGMGLATHLAELGVKPASLTFLSSPLGRACETARLVRQACSLEGSGFGRDACFAEAAYGDWEGLTLDEARLALPGDFERRRADRVNFVPTGGESFADLQKRVLSGLATLGERQVLICHGGVVKVIWGAYLGLPATEAQLLDIRQDRVFRFTPGDLSLI